jgi:hypothetical protein
MPQPPYSHDQAPRDLYLFPPVKEKLGWIQLTDENQSFEFLQAILSGLDHKELNDTFALLFSSVPFTFCPLTFHNPKYIFCNFTLS